MIRPSNIDKDNHTADFVCEGADAEGNLHGGVATGVDLNTQCPYSDDNKSIIVSGSLLTPPCDCASYFPTENGNQDAKDLAEAKTA